MKRQVNTATHLVKFAAFALVLLALQMPSVLGHPRPSAQQHETCSKYVSTGFGGYYQLDDKKPVCQAAVPAFRSAAVIVTGQTNDQHIAVWLLALNSNPTWKAKFNEGLKFSDAVAFLKERIANQGAVADRAKVIENAFQEVYGRNSTPTEQVTWDAQIRAQQAWYMTIVGAEKARLNGDPALRRDMINRVYYAAMGRPADEVSYQYWMPQPDHYAQMIEANRRWLYSPNGAQDLVGTVTRALLKKTGGSLQTRVEPEKVKAAIVKYTSSKRIYIEMLKQ